MDNLPAMSTHNFHNEGTLMRVRSTNNSINSFNNAMQGRISTDSHVSTTEIIINRANLKLFK